MNSLTTLADTHAVKDIATLSRRRRMPLPSCRRKQIDASADENVSARRRRRQRYHKVVAARPSSPRSN